MTRTRTGTNNVNDEDDNDNDKGYSNTDNDNSKDHDTVPTAAGPSTAAASAAAPTHNIILIVGACGLDRLVTVSQYPPADAKVRTTAYGEVGGGNAANTAHCLSLLLSSVIQPPNGWNSNLKDHDHNHDHDYNHNHDHDLQNKEQENGTNENNKDSADADDDKDDDRQHPLLGRLSLSSSSSSALSSRLPSSDDDNGGSSFWRIQLGTVIGDDAMGKIVQRELVEAQVELKSPLFQIKADTTTAFTTVIVESNNTQQDPTRTCFHTPGSCGELNLGQVQHDVPNFEMAALLENVAHVHSDSRHLDVAYAIARCARAKGISVSLDVEKDRHNVYLDRLLPLSTIIFTNAHQIEAYLHRLGNDFERHKNQYVRSCPTPTLQISRDPDDKEECGGWWEHPEFLLQVLQPSLFCTHWYRHSQIGKEIVITKGRQGSVHIKCETITEDDDERRAQAKIRNRITVAAIRTDSSSSSSSSSRTQSPLDQDCTTTILSAAHEYTEEATWNNRKHSSSESANVRSSTQRTIRAVYTMTFMGASHDIVEDIIDTTGAGDAYCGAYLAATCSNSTQNNNGGMWHQTGDRMRLAAWVAGRKLGCPGARLGMPLLHEIQQRLGRSPRHVRQRLRDLVGAFEFEVHDEHDKRTSSSNTRSSLSGMTKTIDARLDWDDRIGIQDQFTLDEKGWKVPVYWRSTPHGAGLFSNETITAGTVLRRGIRGVNLQEFTSRADIDNFCRSSGGTDGKRSDSPRSRKKAKLEYVKDYLWGFSTATDDRGYAVNSKNGATSDDDRFFGLWIPGNGLNHNEHPNTVYRATPDGIDLVALVDIRPDDELFDDYRRHGTASDWLKEFATIHNVTLNFADCNDFV